MFVCALCAGPSLARAEPITASRSRRLRAHAPNARNRGLLMNSNSPLPQAARIYAIGDIHGRSDLLDHMVEQICRDLESRPVGECLTVTLGDYFDRGPNSRGVLDRLVRNPFPTPFMALKGNHEAMFERFLDDPSVADQWGATFRPRQSRLKEGSRRRRSSVTATARDSIPSCASIPPARPTSCQSFWRRRSASR
jgi:hypothetical protein